MTLIGRVDAAESTVFWCLTNCPSVIQEVHDVSTISSEQQEAVGSALHDITVLLSTCKTLQVTDLWNVRAGRKLSRSTPLNFRGKLRPRGSQQACARDALGPGFPDV